MLQKPHLPHYVNPTQNSDYANFGQTDGHFQLQVRLHVGMGHIKIKFLGEAEVCAATFEYVISDRPGFAAVEGG